MKQFLTHFSRFGECMAAAIPSSPPKYTATFTNEHLHLLIGHQTLPYNPDFSTSAFREYFGPSPLTCWPSLIYFHPRVITQREAYLNWERRLEGEKKPMLTSCFGSLCLETGKRGKKNKQTMIKANGWPSVMMESMAEWKWIELANLKSFH